MTAEIRTDTPDQYFSALLDSLREVYKYLASLDFKVPDRGFPIVEVIGRMAGIGIRQLEACDVCIKSGYVIESFACVRTVWELSVDAGFMMSSFGKNRLELCDRYFATEYLRAPTREFFESDPPVLPRHAIEDYRLAMERHGADPTVFDLRAHWSGMGKGKVRTIGGGYIDALFQGSTMYEATKKVLFGPASMVSHADPGVNRLTPHDQRGWPRVGPVHGKSEVMLIPASTAGTILLAVVSQRASAAMKAHAVTMIERSYHMIREHVGVADGRGGDAAQ